MQRTLLPSGVRVLTEQVAGQRSAVVGAWVRTGSCDEPAALNGVTHLLEHLVFKGTRKRTALDIAQAFDAIGGDINAYTTKEFTCFHARVLGEDVPMALDTIVDMLQDARLDDADVASERAVVLEEIAMHEDTPDDIVFDYFTEAMWPSHPLGRRVQGREGTVAAMRTDDVAGYYRDRYAADTTVISAAGAVDHERIVELAAALTRSSSATVEPTPTPVAASSLHVIERDIEQDHFVYGTPGIARDDERRWALGVLNVALGAGLSSRLFQEIRERRGLAYAISSGHQGYRETGVFSIYAGCGPDNVEPVLSIVREQIADLLDKGPTKEEVDRAIGHLAGTLAISMDDPGAVMSHLGKSELIMKEVLTVEEMMNRIHAVSVEQVAAVAHDVLAAGDWSLTVLGPSPKGDLSGFVGEAA